MKLYNYTLVIFLSTVTKLRHDSSIRVTDLSVPVGVRPYFLPTKALGGSVGPTRDVTVHWSVLISE